MPLLWSEVVHIDEVGCKVTNIILNSSKPLYFIHGDKHIVDVEWYDGGIDNFISCYGEFAVHRYDWSIAMREIDEHEEDMEEESDEIQ
jgi:hypothetical protein